MMLISTGGMLRTAVEVADQLAVQGVSAHVLSLHTVALDAKAVRVAAKETRLLATVEEHRVYGGLGSAVAEVLAGEKNLRAPLLRFAVADNIHKSVGSQSFCLETSGLSVHDLVEAICDSFVRGKRCEK